MMLIHKLCNSFCRHRNQINQCKITKEQNIFEQFYSFYIQYNDIQSDNLTKTKYKNTKISPPTSIRSLRTTSFSPRLSGS